MIPGQTTQPVKKHNKTMIISFIFLNVTIIALVGVAAYLGGKAESKRIAVDFTIENFKKDEREPKYKFVPAELSNYICDMCEELEIDSDRAISQLMVENPDFDPNAIHRNENGTVDLGEFQLNDRSLWTSFIPRYWFSNIEFDPFNWKHNTYIALHHMKYLDDKFKIQDDAIMAYNCGEGNVMNGTIPVSTKIYLAKVKNNLFLLKDNSEN